MLTLTSDVRQAKVDIKELHAEIHKLALVVQMLSNKIENVAHHEENERRIIKLELENALLKQNMLPGKKSIGDE